MTYRMYCLYNKATELYEGIMLYRSDVVACRALDATFEANRGRINPDDLELYCLGTFDNETAKLVYQGDKGKVEYVPRSVPEESLMSSKKDENSVL